MPHSSVPHRSCRWVGYTKVWNFLDYTALVLPAGKVDRLVDPPKGTEWGSKRGGMNDWNRDLYDPEMMHGQPISIQIVGKRLEEEKVLGTAKVIEEVISRIHAK